MDSQKYSGMDVHQATISVAVMNQAGKVVMASVIETKARTRELYATLLATGMRPTMARLPVARKIAAIVLSIWKKRGCFDPGQLKRQAA